MSVTALLLEQNWNAVPGGTARAGNRLIRALLDHTDHHIVGVHGSHRKDATLAVPSGLDIIEIPLPGRALQQIWSRVDQPLLDRWVDASVVHFPAYVMAPTSGARVVTIHDLAFVRHPEWFTSNGVAFLSRFLERVRRSDATVITPSSITADDCLAIGIDESRVHTIPWGIDAARAPAHEIDRVRDRYSLPERFVLYVGTLEPRKNVGNLVEAMRAVENVPLVIVGPQGWGEVDRGDSLTLGEVPDADLGPLMACATVLAYPSHFEGFGLPVLEAMAQGTPVMTTRKTAPAEIAGGAGLAVDTHSPAMIATALTDMVNSPNELKEMGTIALARAQNYRWAETAAAHVAIYEELA